MAKKGESDEKVQADGGQAALGETVSGEPGEREAAALVAGGDRGAAEGEGAQPEAPAPGAAGDGAGVVSDDGEAPAPVVPAGDPGAGETDAQGTDQAAAGASPDGATNVKGGGDLAAGAPAAVMGTADQKVYGSSPVLDALGAAALLQVISSAAEHDAGKLDAASRRPTMLEDPAFHVAVGGYSAVLDVARHLSTSREDDAEEYVDNRMSDAAFGDIAAFVRKIGKRATADVIGQQLKILGHRASPDLSEPERIAFAVFAHVLVELDAFSAAEAERARKAAETPAEVPPLPVEETTLEPVDDHFDTWR